MDSVSKRENLKIVQLCKHLKPPVHKFKQYKNPATICIISGAESHHKQHKAVGNTAGGFWFMAAWLSAYLNHSGSG